MGSKSIWRAHQAEHLLATQAESAVRESRAARGRHMLGRANSIIGLQAATADTSLAKLRPRGGWRGASSGLTVRTQRRGQKSIEQEHLDMALLLGSAAPAADSEQGLLRPRA